MDTVKSLMTDLADNTRKFLGKTETLSLQEMAEGVDEAANESDYQTELIAEFDELISGAVGSDQYTAGRDVGIADTLSKRTELVVTENGEYDPPEGLIGFSKVNVKVPGVSFDAIVTGEGAIDIGENDFAPYTRITDYFLQYAKGIRSMVLPDRLDRGGRTAFANMPHLEEVSIPGWQDGSYGTKYTFSACAKLHTVHLRGESKFGGYSFQGCPKLTTVDWHQITQMGEYCFANCTSLKRVLINCYVGSRAFYECSGLETIEFGTAASIGLGDISFCKCKALKSVTFPDNVTGLGSQCFAFCSALEYVSLGAGISNIYYTNCFQDCPIKTMVVRRATPPTLGGPFQSLTTLEKIVVPIGSGDAYKAATNWSTYADIIVEEDI